MNRKQAKSPLSVCWLTFDLIAVFSNTLLSVPPSDGTKYELYRKGRKSRVDLRNPLIQQLWRKGGWMDGWMDGVGREIKSISSGGPVTSTAAGVENLDWSAEFCPQPS
ncbi:hypothetical protein XENORESO_009576 [Xenotaenia resolanae]|uniref:Secreted protein n=1 Tax=Xenotaenia resolanae TaxID=208358 RepID=A0ABV0WW12_9TELE